MTAPAKGLPVHNHAVIPTRDTIDERFVIFPACARRYASAR
jgi:hypothetical protein